MTHTVAFQNNLQLTAHGYAITSAHPPRSAYIQVKNLSIKQASWYQCLTNTVKINLILKLSHCSTNCGYHYAELITKLPLKRV